MRLGYYLQAPFDRETGTIPFDVEVWARHFGRLCDRFVCFMHHGANPLTMLPVPPGVEIVDLGPLRPHWQRIAGVGLPRALLNHYGQALDAVLIQGPTSAASHLADAVAPALPVFLLVGFWSDPASTEFRPHSDWRNLAIKGLGKFNDWQLRRAFGRGLVLGNNPAMEEYVGGAASFHLVSKAPIERHELGSGEVRRPHDPFRVVYFGRVDPDKHLETVVEASATLGEGVVFDLVGPGLGSYVQHLQTEISRRGLEERVCFHGNVHFPDRLDFLRRYDAMVFHTGRTEGFPRAIWDGMAADLPVVAASYPGGPRFLEHGKHVWFFPRRDAAALAESLARLRSDAEMRACLVREGHALLAEHTAERATRHIYDLIEKKLSA